MIWLALLGALPWLVVGAVLTVGIRDPRPLPPFPVDGSEPPDLPSVTIVVPARNEARNIERCLASLAAQRYPDFVVVVVDDRSGDDTAARARGMPRGNSRAIRVIDGAALPAGWFGKPWACHQGASAARSELLVFTDADTRHNPALLRRAVDGLREDRVDALSVNGRQELGSFGERLVQPHVFALLGLRYRRLDRPLGPENARDAIANGQYLLVRQEAYTGVGGHAAVRGEVVEDLRFAQVFTGSGYRLTLRDGADAFSTRMYRSLREVVDGWTKNLAVGARQSAARWEAWVLPAIVGFLLFFWVLPAGVALGGGIHALAGGDPSPWLFTWSTTTMGVGLLIWLGIYARFEVSPAYALLFPAGAAIAAWIVIRSWLRGEKRIEWKGRRYTSGWQAPAGGDGA